MWRSAKHMIKWYVWKKLTRRASRDFFAAKLFFLHRQSRSASSNVDKSARPKNISQQKEFDQHQHMNIGKYVSQYLPIFVSTYLSPSPLPIFVVLLLPRLARHPLAPSFNVYWCFLFRLYMWKVGLENVFKNILTLIFNKLIWSDKTNLFKFENNLIKPELHYLIRCDKNLLIW